MNSIGSIWRKWDLHIHTPASYQWSGKKWDQQTPAERDATCEAIITKINSLDVSVFCIMDYWTFEGYVAVREYLHHHVGATTKPIFPGIEMRLEAPTNHRLNTHVLFDNALPTETLMHFLTCLRVGGPEGKPPSRQNLIDLARGYDEGKLRQHGFKPEDRGNEDKMHLLGLQTAVVTRESLQDATKLVGEDDCLIIQPYDTNDGLEDLDWKSHPYTDQYLMKMADIFETRNPIAVDLFLGLGHPRKPTLGSEFVHNLGGYPKPVVSGSDAHSIARYGEYPGNRITWLKAQPTFAGLRQVCTEPALRCFIGSTTPKQDHIAQNPTKYMRHLQIEKVPGSPVSDYWFDKIEIDLNPGLIAIIGNKGTGKSALADIVALAANTHCSDLEFLTAKRFRKGTNISKYFRATLTWADQTWVQISLDQNPDTGLPERVRYLPQQFIENLCNEIESGGGNFERELKKVIFSHVPEESQLQKASLDDLIDYKVGSHRKAVLQLQSKLHTLNGDILRIERDLSEDTIKSYVMALSLKQAEVDAHEKTRPKEVKEPSEGVQSPAERQTAEDLAGAQIELAEYNKQLALLKSERTSLVATAALLDRLNGHLDNLESSYASFVEQTAPEFAQSSLNLTEIVSLTINRVPISTRLADTRSRLGQIAVTINGSKEQKGLEDLAKETATRVARLQNDLGARQREYQAYLTEQGRWQARQAEIEGTSDKPDTIQFLQTRIKAAQETLPTTLYDLKNQRRQLVRDIHNELLKVRAVYQELYGPVQQMVAESSGFTKEPLHLDFSAFLTPSRFESDFLDYIHRNRIGNFYGEIESKKVVEGLLSSRDFNSTDDVVAFVEDIMAALTTVDRNGVKEAIAIQSQMKDPRKMADLYDFLFGLRYLEPRYALKLGEKDISQLSPGEKGALLLVFYLLLDPEEIPIIIDQPEQNLDNESVVKLLVDCIRQARARRQVVIVTHNPNLAVVCDADQIICCYLDKAGGNRVSYDCGAIEDNPINKRSVDVLEGTYAAFDNRRKKYHKPAVTQ